MAHCLISNCGPPTRDDRAGTLPTLPRLAALGFQGDLLGDSGFKGAPFAAAALVHDIHVSVSPGGTRDGRFLLSGIRWVVERLFAWLDRKSTRLNSSHANISYAVFCLKKKKR